MAKLGEKLKVKYEPIWEQAPVDLNFHYYETQEDGTEVLRIYEDKFKQVRSIEELKEFAKTCEGKLVGFDTETTGLTYGVDEIVGFSLSIDRYSGIYVPIRHKNVVKVTERVDKLDENGNVVLTKAGRPSRTTITKKEYYDCDENLDPKEALDVLYGILKSAKLVVAHNAEFDLNMYKFEGYNVNDLKVFDTLILPYLFDPEATGLAKLKALEKRILGRTVPEFSDVLGKQYDTFAEAPPREGYLYASYDSAGVLGIYEEMYPVVKELLGRFRDTVYDDGKPYNVLVKDNQMVKMFVDYYGHAKILIDREKAIKYKEQLQEEQRKVVEQIYTYFDKGMFNLSPSSKEFRDVMASKNLSTGVTSEKTGLTSFSKKATVEMKKTIARIKEGLLNWKYIQIQDGKLSKMGPDAFAFATAIVTLGAPYFDLKPSVNFVQIKDKYTGKKIDTKTFWLTVKEMYKTEMGKLNALALIQKNNSLNKAATSYVDKLTQVDECFMHYRLKGTKSGRLSSGNGSKSDKRKNHYYIDLNAQNLTKPASAYFSATECAMDDPEGVLGWKFEPLDKDYAMEHLEDLYIVEGQDPGITVRGCLRAPDGDVKVACVPEDNGTLEKEVFEVEFDNGSVIKCCKDTVFKVRYRGNETFMTLEAIMKHEDEVEIIGT